jgi:hypothetical protein
MCTDADLYRNRAAECRQQAERSVRVADKESWLQIARDWMNLVQSAEHPAGDVAAALNRLYVVK